MQRASRNCNVCSAIDIEHSNELNNGNVYIEHKQIDKTLGI